MDEERFGEDRVSLEAGDVDDETMVALVRLERALQLNLMLARRSMRRAAQIKRLRRRGLGYREIVANEDRPLIVEMMRENLTQLVDAGSDFQHAEARALYAEGMTMEEIAELYGVTRQRISAMLKKQGRRL